MKPFADGAVDHYISVGFGLSALPDADATRLELPKGVYSGGIGTLAFRDLVKCPPGHDDLLCGHYSSIDFDPTHENSAVCKGDSGGPLFGITASRELRVAGVTSARLSMDPGCDPKAEAFSEYTNLASHRDWLRSVTGAALDIVQSETRAECADAIWSSKSGSPTSIELRAPPKSQISFAVAGVDYAEPPSITLRPATPDGLCRPILNQRDLLHCAASGSEPVGFEITGSGVAQLSICSVP